MSSIALAADIEKLKSIVPEKQALFLFNVLSTYYRNLALLDTTIVSAQCSSFLDDLILVLRSPGLHRAHRNLVGRCFVTIFRRADRSPFETTNKILSLLQRERDEKYRWNAIVALGVILENVGDQIASLTGELIVSLGRIIKSSSTSPGVKSAALNTIGAALSQTTKLDDNLHKEVSKFLRGCLPDKSAVVHTAAYDVRLPCCRDMPSNSDHRSA